jgi:hypothetical protein
MASRCDATAVAQPNHIDIGRQQHTARRTTWHFELRRYPAALRSDPGPAVRLRTKADEGQRFSHEDHAAAEARPPVIAQTANLLMRQPQIGGQTDTERQSLPALVDQPVPRAIYPQIALRLCERQRSLSGAERSIVAGVWGDGTLPIEPAMVGDGMTVGRVVRMGLGNDRRPIEDAMEGHLGALSMCFRRLDAGPVSTLTIFPAVNKRSMAARKAPADMPFASGSPANSNGALPRPLLGRTGRP